MRQAGGLVGAQLTFAVCINCGVQSPLVGAAGDVPKALTDMGWHVTPARYTMLALCPQCQEVKNGA
jgi:hypothetical protein